MGLHTCDNPDCTADMCVASRKASEHDLAGPIGPDPVKLPVDRPYQFPGEKPVGLTFVQNVGTDPVAEEVYRRTRRALETDRQAREEYNEAMKTERFDVDLSFYKLTEDQMMSLRKFIYEELGPVDLSTTYSRST